MTHVTCRLTAKNRDQLRNPTLGNRVWASFTFTFFVSMNDSCTSAHVWHVSARRSATLPGRPLCAGGVYVRSSPVSLCSLRGSPGALDSDVNWPSQLCCVWLQDLELTTNGPAITRTAALFIQAPAQNPLVCSSTRQCSWLQLWVSCTVVRRCCDCTATLAPTTNVQTRLRQSSLLPQHRISCRELLHVSESLSRNVRHSRTHSCNTTNAVNPLQ